VDDVPFGRGVLFEVLRVGVNCTDKEIDDAEYGDPPKGYDFLVTGHESFGRVLEAGPNVQGLQNRRLCGGHRQTARYQHQVFVEVNGRV
jgi:D-arabinose 1-dehydrogenase-like Zn-dependent alcohol dehydrogenase